MKKTTDRLFFFFFFFFLFCLFSFFFYLFFFFFVYFNLYESGIFIVFICYVVGNSSINELCIAIFRVEFVINEKANDHRALAKKLADLFTKHFVISII